MSTTIDRPGVGGFLTSTQWRDYFERNVRSLAPAPWEIGPELSDEERRDIRASVQGFQLGESSEGRHLYGCARAHAEATGDPDYAHAAKLFIQEEQRHARELGRFMDLNGIPRIGHSWPDAVFRFLRHRADLEVSIAVLVTAEVIAQSYYAALCDATDSFVLRAICEQILRDELEHVRFQCQRLAILRSHRGPTRLAITHALQRTLYAGAVLVVWAKYWRTLRRGGFGPAGWWRSCWKHMRAALREMDSRTHAPAGVALS
jgi:hypothetical protein